MEQITVKYDMSKMTKEKVCALFFKRYENGIYYEPFRNIILNNPNMLLSFGHKNFATNMCEFAKYRLGIKTSYITAALYYIFIKNNFINLTDIEKDSIYKCIQNFTLKK